MNFFENFLEQLTSSEIFFRFFRNFTEFFRKIFTKNFHENCYQNLKREKFLLSTKFLKILNKFLKITSKFQSELLHMARKARGVKFTIFSTVYEKFPLNMLQNKFL